MQTTTVNEQEIREKLAAAEARAEKWRAIASHERETGPEESQELREQAEANPGIGNGDAAAWNLYYDAQGAAQRCRDALEDTERDRKVQAERDGGTDPLRERAEHELEQVRAGIARLETRHAAMCYMALEPRGYAEQNIEDVERGLDALRIRERRALAALKEAERRENNDA